MQRFGKTTAVSMFMAAYCLSCPKSEQAVFSTGRRASQKMLENVRDMIRKVVKPERILKCNQEVIVIAGDEPGDVRKINSYPACAKTLRGTGGDVVYMEEVSLLLSTCK
jgi:hypothetical protein